jgi:hypothetical protein
MPEVWLRASEIGEYAYCSRAWWLRRVRGIEPSDMAPLRAGTDAHRRHARGLAVARWARRAGWVLLAFVVVMAILALAGAAR